MSATHTVIITSHLRTTYIGEAFRSVLDQSLASSFEVVVLTALAEPPFQDSFAELAESRGVRLRLVRTGDVPIGRSLAAGFEASTGSVISLLDDDDLWERGKLARVDEVFSTDTALVLYHHGQTIIDDNGNPVPWWNAHRLIRHPSTRLGPQLKATLAPGDVSALRAALKMEVLFNNSSLSIRREVIASHATALSRLSGGEDTFLFYCALLENRNILATTERLTRFRVHRAATTAGIPGPSAERSRLEGYTEYAKRSFDRVEACQSLVSQSPNALATLLLRRDLARWSLLRRILLGRGIGRSLKSDIGSILQAGGIGLDPSDLLTLAAGLCAKVCNSCARTVILTWRRIW